MLSIYFILLTSSINAVPLPVLSTTYKNKTVHTQPFLFVLQWYQGAEPDLMFELRHQNTQSLVFKPRPSSTSSIGGDKSRGGSDRYSSVTDRNSGGAEDASSSNKQLSLHVKSSADTTTPQLVFRTDSATATNKYVKGEICFIVLL
jgi:hypothetical protein